MNPVTISLNTKILPAIWKKPSVRVAAVLAHEIRNPLTNINLSINMLESAIQNSELKKYLDIIMRSSARINDLVNELLEYKQVEEMETEKYSIHQLMDEVLEITKDRIMLKNIAVSKDYAAKDFNMLLNRPEMKIALTNIIINAIDAMSSKNGVLTLVTKSMGPEFVIRIEDNGCGISKTNLQYIFKPYFTNKPGGLGLGLAATYNILQSNHIGVSVQSEEGHGTEFILVFGEKKRCNLQLTKKWIGTLQVSQHRGQLMHPVLDQWPGPMAAQEIKTHIK